MRKVYIIWITVVLAIAGFVVWWTSKRKLLLREKLTGTVTQKSDSLYKITYDSTSFDEVAGNATIYNLHLSVDTTVLQRVIQQDTIPGILVDVRVKTIRIAGLQSLDLLSGYSIDVKSIELNEPSVVLTKLKPAEKKMVRGDTLELYQRILGRYTLLRSGNIAIRNGSIKLNDLTNGRQISVSNLGIDMRDFIVDSLHNYNNIAAYFVKNTSVTVNEVKVANPSKGKNLQFHNINYNSDLGYLYCTDVHSNNQYIGGISFTGLNTYEFIYRQGFYSKKLNIKDVTLFLKPSQDPDKEPTTIEIGSIFSAIKVDTFQIESARLELKTKEKDSKDKFILKNIDATIYNIAIDSNGLAIEKYLKNSSFYVRNFEYVPPSKKIHGARVQEVTYDAHAKRLSIGKVSLYPTITRTQLAQNIGYQKDMFNITMSNIQLFNNDVGQLIAGRALKADSVALDLNLKVYNDKTIRMDSIKKIGNYPHQKIKKFAFGLELPVVFIRNGDVTYEEKALRTGKVGQIQFNRIRGTISNINNKGNSNGSMILDMNALFMNRAPLSTKWDMPLNTKNGSFTVYGNVQSYNLPELNPAMKALSMVEIKSGHLNTLNFEVIGNDTSSVGFSNFKYDDLKINLLEKEKNDSIGKKKFTSFLANALIKNSNKKDDKQPFSYKRDVYKSYFNLILQSVMEGVRKTVL